MPGRNHRERGSAGWPAVAAACLLLLGSGVGYRRLAAFYARPTESVAIAPGTLARFPLEIGGWVGREQPLDDAVIEATDTDDHLSRIYRRPGGVHAVSLYVAYGVRLRDLAPHRPEVCYPAAGWSPEGVDRRELALSNGSALPCRVDRFRRGGLTSSRVTVLSYYIIDGLWYGDVTELRSRQAQFSQGKSYSAQVQVVCASSLAEEVCREQVMEFGSTTAVRIRDLLVEAVDTAIDASAPAGEGSS